MNLPEPLVILGIDPGSRLAGYGLIRCSGPRYEHIENGTLYLRDIPDFPSRLAFMHRELTRLIREFGAGVVAVENVFYHKNPVALQRLAEARGAALLTGAMAGIAVAEYSALQVKQAVTGYGKAGKTQVQLMIRRLLSLKDIPEENAGDALAVALCHAFQSSHRLRPYLSGEKSSGTSPARELLKKASFYRR